MREERKKPSRERERVSREEIDGGASSWEG